MKPSEPLELLQLRIRALERKDRIKGGLLFLLISGGLAALVMGQTARPSPPVVTARAFELVDEQNRVRAKLTMREVGGPAVPLSRPELTFFNEEGEAVAGYWHGGLMYAAPPGWKERDFAVSLNMSTGLELRGRDGTIHLDAISISREGMNGATLTISDRNGTRIALGRNELTTIKSGVKEVTSPASITLFDESGKVRWQAP